MELYLSITDPNKIKDLGIADPRYIHQTVCPPFRTDGKYMLRSLFYELQNNRQELLAPIQDEIGPRPIYTLKCYDHEIDETSPIFRHGSCNLLRSLYLVYLEYGDPSEYSFALGTLGDWQHWCELRECAFFKPYLTKMREALKAKIDSETLLAAKEVLRGPQGTGTLQAAKWLRDAVSDQTKTKRGRPSNDEVKNEVKRLAQDEKDLAADLIRINSLGISSNG